MMHPNAQPNADSIPAATSSHSPDELDGSPGGFALPNKPESMCTATDRARRPAEPQAATESDIDLKVQWARKRLRELESVIVAFSAGVDSTFVAALAAEELGPRALAVTATSPSFPERELREAKELAETLGLHHHIIRSQELANPDYAANPVRRCYHCKTELYGELRQVADDKGYRHIVDGANLDDIGDYRPGREAAQENGVVSILQEAGLTKSDIRRASAHLNLKTADKPAFACLASRFPYGQEITADALQQVEHAEDFLHARGFRQFRVRVHQDIARIELPPDEIPRMTEPELRQQTIEQFRALGYRYVTLDLQGYRSGSLNEGKALRAGNAV